MNGHADVATFLVTECGADVNAVNDEGFTALLWAAQGGFLDVVKMLQTHGADIRALDNRRTNALVLAAGNGHLDLVTWLAGQGVDVMTKANHGNNALMIAAYDDRPDVCLFLISLGLDPALEHKEGESALTHYAQWLDEDNPNRLEDEERPPLSDEEKQARVKLLTEARAEYLELRRCEERYQRRKDAITFLQGYGFLLTAASVRRASPRRHKWTRTPSSRPSTAAPRRPTSST